MTKKFDTGVTVNADFSKNIHYVDKKGRVMSCKRGSKGPKKVIGHVSRKPGFLYYVKGTSKGRGKVMYAKLKSKKSRS